MHFETTFAGNIFFHLSTRQAKYRLYLLNDKRVKNKCYFTEARIRLSDCGVICRNKAICFNGTRWKRIEKTLLRDEFIHIFHVITFSIKYKDIQFSVPLI